MMPAEPQPGEVYRSVHHSNSGVERIVLFEVLAVHHEVIVEYRVLDGPTAGRVLDLPLARFLESMQRGGA